LIGKFLKIAGKDPDGNVKGVAVTENGEVKVQQTGSIGQTRDGKDEWITPITMWERQLSTGLYLPPGAIEDNSDVGKPRIKADELEGLLEEIRDKDFATDTKLELVRALLESINSKDYSTEVTLQAVLTELANLSNGTKAMKVQQTGSIVSYKNLLENVIIPVNTTLYTDVVNFSTNLIGWNIMPNVAGNLTVAVVPRFRGYVDGKYAMAVIKILDNYTSAKCAFGSLDKIVATHYNLQIVNNHTEDVILTIDELLI
jgi:hypothetical protein